MIENKKARVNVVDLKARLAKIKAMRFPSNSSSKIYGEDNTFIFSKSYNCFEKNIIRGTNHFIFFPEADAGNVVFEVYGDNNKIIIQKGAKLLNTRFVIKGSDNFIEIKENCRFTSCYIVNYSRGNKIIIDNGTTIEEAALALGENNFLSIGKDCMLSAAIDIRCGDGHKMLDLSTGEQINKSKDIIIKDHVWICRAARILKGVTIGKNSVIGVGSICTKSIPENCMAAGIPATVKRENVTWQR